MGKVQDFPHVHYLAATIFADRESISFNEAFDTIAKNTVLEKVKNRYLAAEKYFSTKFLLTEDEVSKYYIEGEPTLIDAHDSVLAHACGLSNED